MALLFIDGFDHYDPQALDPAGDPWLARGKATVLSQYAERIPGRRPSSYALRLPEGSGGGYVKTFDSGRGSLIVGAAIRVAPYDPASAAPVLLGVLDATTAVRHVVSVTPDGRVQVLDEDDTVLAVSETTVPARGWHYIEVQVTQGTTDGSIDVRCNGALAIHLPVQDTLRGGGLLKSVFVGAVPGQPCPVTVDVDDLYIADTSGTINNTCLGDVRVDVLTPTADGSLNDWIADPPTVPRWQAVADTDEATAVQSSASGDQQTFVLSALPVMTTPAIHGVQVVALARKTDAGAASIQGVMHRNGGTVTGAASVLQTQLAWHTALFEADVTGTQWTEATLASEATLAMTEFGVAQA
jgi:hypothetical protein